MANVYYRRHEEIFNKDCLSWLDEEKVRLLLCKVALAEYGRYCNLILPKKSREICFQKTIESFLKIFCDKSL